MGTAFHSNVIQLMYGHRISGRMDFMIGAGPQFTHIDPMPPNAAFWRIPIETLPGQCFTGEFVTVHQSVNHIGAAGRVSLRYSFPKTTVSLSYQRLYTNGNGDFCRFAQRYCARSMRAAELTRVWDLFSRCRLFQEQRACKFRVQPSAADKFQDGYAGVGLHRQFGRSLRAFASYQFNYLSFDTECPIPGTSGAVGGCSNHVAAAVSVRLDWIGLPGQSGLINFELAARGPAERVQMMENRELTMDDYLAMLRRRMKVILIPALLAPAGRISRLLRVSLQSTPRSRWCWWKRQRFPTPWCSRYSPKI